MNRFALLLLGGLLSLFFCVLMLLQGKLDNRTVGAMLHALLVVGMVGYCFYLRKTNFDQYLHVSEQVSVLFIVEYIFAWVLYLVILVGGWAASQSALPFGASLLGVPIAYLILAQILRRADERPG